MLDQAELIVSPHPTAASIQGKSTGHRQLSKKFIVERVMDFEARKAQAMQSAEGDARAGRMAGMLDVERSLVPDTAGLWSVGSEN